MLLVSSVGVTGVGSAHARPTPSRLAARTQNIIWVGVRSLSPSSGPQTTDFCLRRRSAGVRASSDPSRFYGRRVPEAKFTTAICSLRRRCGSSVDDRPARLLHERCLEVHCLYAASRLAGTTAKRAQLELRRARGATATAAADRRTETNGGLGDRRLARSTGCRCRRGRRCGRRSTEGRRGGTSGRRLGRERRRSGLGSKYRRLGLERRRPGTHARARA